MICFGLNTSAMCVSNFTVTVQKKCRHKLLLHYCKWHSCVSIHNQHSNADSYIKYISIKGKFINKIFHMVKQSLFCFFVGVVHIVMYLFKFVYFAIFGIIKAILLFFNITFNVFIKKMSKRRVFLIITKLI